MSRREIPDHIQDRIYAEEQRLLGDKLGFAVRRILDANVGDTLSQQELEKRVSRHRISQAYAGPIDVPPVFKVGNLVLGRDLRLRDVLVCLDLLLTHSLTLGTTGSGKTTQTLSLVEQVAAELSGLWLVDVTKRDFRKARKLLARLGIDLLIVPGKQLLINLFEVPRGVQPVDWITRSAELLVQVLDLPPRASKLLHTHLFRISKSLGVLSGGSHFPTLRDLDAAVRADRSANTPAREALLDSLAPVMAALPNMANCRKGWPVEDLASQAILFDLTGLPRTAQNLLLTMLLLAIFTQRVAAGVSNVPLDLLICVDEAQRLLSTPGSSQNALSDLWPLVRGLGIGLQLGIPSAHGLMPEALSFTGNKWLGRCGSATDYQAFGAAMGLTREQIVWAAQNLKAGTFVVQLGETDWRKPFVIRTQLPQGPLVVDLTPAHLGPLANQPVVMATDQATTMTTTKSAPVVTGPLANERAVRFLRAVVDKPLLPSSTYAKLAGISAQTAVKVRQELVTAGLLIERKLQPAGRGRVAVLLEPTKAAVQALANLPARGGAA